MDLLAFGVDPLNSFVEGYLVVAETVSAVNSQPLRLFLRFPNRLALRKQQQALS
mgnify:CR=1 FL=1